MNFKNSFLEKIFKEFKWARNNTIELFDLAAKDTILGFTSTSVLNKKDTFQSILFQFQCIITTSDAYYRKFIQHPNTEYGILISEKNSIQKKEITPQLIKKILRSQLILLETTLKEFDQKTTEKYLGDITTLSNHEYLHQGQLIVMFREANKELPERFKKAWAL